jgi:nonsense-mediated mRNA decay protein 3
MLICPKCGKTGNSEDFIEAFCVNCYEFNIKVPAVEEIKRCKQCNRIYLRGVWQPYSDILICEYIEKKCKGEFTTATFDSLRSTVLFTIKRGEREFVIERPVRITFVKTLCSDCSKARSGYYEAIIQLRGDERKIKRYHNILERLLEKTTFITKSEEVKGGLDIYVGSTAETLNVLSKLKLDYLITKKLVGYKNGKRLFRTTFAIRF